MLSLIFWAITMIVSVGYVTFIMRADDKGEGGIMSLTGLLQGAKAKRSGLTVGLDHARGAGGGAVLRRQHDHPRDLGALGSRRSEGGGSEPGLAGAADRDRGADGAVRDPALRDGPGGQAVRAGDGRLVHRAGGDRHPGDRAPPGDPARPVAELRGRVLHPPRRGRVRRAGGGRPGGDRGRGAVCRHGALRPLADPAGVVLPRVPGADDQLPRPGRADPALAEGGRKPVLPAGARVGADTRPCSSRRLRP